MEVQIFGVRKSAATRAALRFFAERRIKTHFVDLNERAASPGELRRFAQKFGVQALIDRDARRLIELGLKSALLSDDRWLEKLTLEPLLLRRPQDVLEAARGKRSAYYGMVTTYWSMAATVVLHGAIDEQMFADANGEHIMVYARLQPFLAELRGLLNNPGYFEKLEQVILRMPDAQARLARFPRPAKGKAATSKGPRRVA